MKTKEICCFCNKQIMFGNSHNAQPVKEGKCCEDCNYAKVIPVRIKLYKKDIEEK